MNSSNTLSDDLNTVPVEPDVRDTLTSELKGLAAITVPDCRPPMESGEMPVLKHSDAEKMVDLLLEAQLEVNTSDYPVAPEIKDNRFVTHSVLLTLLDKPKKGL